MKKLSIILICLLLGSFVYAQSSMQPNIQGYFAVINGQATGPYDTLGLLTLISNGRLDRNTYVWRNGMSNWELAGRIAELAPLFALTPPPVPSATPAQVTPPPAAPVTPPPTPEPAPTRTTQTATARAASTAPARGQSIHSIGGGIIWDWSFNNGVQIGNIYTGARNMLLGGFFFYDARYVEAGLHIGPVLKADVMEASGSSNVKNVESMEFDGLQFGIGVLGKFPFNVGPVILFPLLGAEVNFYTADIGLSQIGFMGGVGCDFFLSDSFFLRAEGLFNLRLPGFDNLGDFFNPPNTITSYTMGRGPRLKLAIGFNF